VNFTIPADISLLKPVDLNHRYHCHVYDLTHNDLFFAVERHQHAGREHRGQRWRERGVLRVQRVDQTTRRRTSTSGAPGLHTATDVLGECRQRVVLQVQAGNTQEPHHYRLPLARPFPDHRPVLQPGRLQQRLPVSARLQHEPGQEVPSVVR